MADKKITELTTYSPPVDNDVLPIVDTTLGVTMKITWANIKAALKTYFDSLTTTLTNKTLTSPVLTTPQINDTSADHQYITAVSELTADRTVTLPLLTGNDEFVFKDHAQTLTNKTLSTGSKLDANADSNFTMNSMARQAIINGNFDVWQRGVSFNISDSTDIFSSDRWVDFHRAGSGGTLPTLTKTREVLTSGDIPGAFYYSRLTTNGAGTSLGTNAIANTKQRIEFGTRFLCGLNKKVTISFWARSSISGKKLGINADQNYGTGGSPSASETINGTNINLTSTWTKYTVTLTTNTLVGKTFGSNNNDFIEIAFTYMWADQYKARFGASAAETYVGAGTIDIAQVQLCAGDVALPFMPKSFEEELRACQRYYEKSFLYETAPAQNAGTSGALTTVVYAHSTIAHAIHQRYTVPKRITVSPTFYNPSAANTKWRGDSDSDSGTSGPENNSQFGFTAIVGSAPADEVIRIHWTADAEL